MLSAEANRAQHHEPDTKGSITHYEFMTTQYSVGTDNSATPADLVSCAG